MMDLIQENPRTTEGEGTVAKDASEDFFFRRPTLAL